MKQTIIKKLKKGQIFKFNEDSENYYIRNHYSREIQRYSYSRYDDINSEFFAKPDRKVFID